MPPRWRRAAGVRVEALGGGWVGFSALSGETLLLNVETAAILEILEAGPLSAERIASELAADTALPLAEIGPLLEASLPALVEVGLIQRA